MLSLLIGGVGEYRLDHMQILLPCPGRGDGVTVPRLAFSREGTHQVVLRDAVSKIHCHNNLLFLPYNNGAV